VPWLPQESRRPPKGEPLGRIGRPPPRENNFERAECGSRIKRALGTKRAVWALPSGVVSLPRPGSGDDEVRKYGALIGIIAAIGTLIVVLIVWGSNGSDAESGACTEIPAGRVPRAIICPRNATPESSKERDCIRVSTLRDAVYWTCSD
jgi:hypothetical protein